MLPGLVLGLLDTSDAIGDREAADVYRGLTVSWSRYGYQDVIIERDSVDPLLEAATAAGHHYCLIQPYGCVLAERWKLDHQGPRDFFAALASWVREHDFVFAGELTRAAGSWYGFAPDVLLVDLREYQRLGAPAFDAPGEPPGELPGELPRPRIVSHGERITALLPSGQVEFASADRWGANAIRSSLAADIPVLALGDELRAHALNLEATSPARRDALRPYLGAGITRYGDDSSDSLSPDQHTLLDVIKAQTANARRGVFLWNIESYDDIESPRDDFRPPVSTLYSVAAGFKPNRMLETHGFDANTRMVYFDYSQTALDVKQYLVEEWDGRDFPRFVRRLFEKFPHPQTFYQLWDDVTPDTVAWKDIELVWQRELDRWGGAPSLSEHWQAYRKLPHEFVCCNLLTDPAPLLATVRDEPSAMIWWSNAFFTMYGNWFYTMEERQQAYSRWAERLAVASPRLYVFGSDFNNTNVNSIQAGEYWHDFRQSGSDCLHPCKLYRTELRM